MFAFICIFRPTYSIYAVFHFPSCSLSDELLTSVSDLMEGRDLDVIVVELSGVADPAAVRQNWDQAVSVCNDILCLSLHQNCQPHSEYFGVFI